MQRQLHPGSGRSADGAFDPFRSRAARTYCDATAQITSSWFRQEDRATCSELVPGHRRCTSMADRIRSVESRKYASPGTKCLSRRGLDAAHVTVVYVRNVEMT